MGSSNADESLISKSLSIPQLIEYVKHSFRDRDFIQVQNALIERENGLKMEIAELILERDFARKEVSLLDSTVSLSKRLKMEDKMERSETKCKKLQENFVRLVEEKQESNNREKQAKEECDRIFLNNMKMTLEKNELINELNNKVTNLQSKCSENEKLAGAHEEKCKALDTMAERMGQEIQELKKEKSDALKIIEELQEEILEANRKISELSEMFNELNSRNSQNEQLAGALDEKCKFLDTVVAEMEQEMDELKEEKMGALKIVEELKGELVEANMTIDELRLKTYEHDKMVDLYRRRLEDLWPKIKKTKEDLAGAVAVKASDVLKLAAGEEGENLNFQDSRDETGSSRNGSTPLGAVDGSGNCGLLKRGCRSSVVHSSLEKGATMVKIPSAETSGHQKTPDSGPHAKSTPPSTGGRCSGTKTVHTPSAPSKVIELIDSDGDDETEPNKAKHEKGPLSDKRRRSASLKELFVNMNNRSNTNTHASHAKGDNVVKSTVEARSDSHIRHHKRVRLADVDSSGSDGKW